MKISVVIPAFNEGDVIEETLSVYLNFLLRNFDEFELIAVNDGSDDDTLRKIQGFKNVICISYPKNRGKGYAVKRGILRATGDYLFFTDADLSFKPEYILEALTLFGEGSVSMVAGERCSLKTDYPLIRRLYSKVFRGFIRVMLPTKLRDTQCGFKGFDKETGKCLFAMSCIEDFGFDFEVVYLMQRLGKKLVTLPISFRHREKTHIKPVRDFLRAVTDLIQIKRSKANGGYKSQG